MVQDELGEVVVLLGVPRVLLEKEGDSLHVQFPGSVDHRVDFVAEQRVREGRVQSLPILAGVDLA